MLEVSGLSASYGVIPALHDVSFSVRESEIVTILGSNGTGKSTILNVVQGMMAGSSGRIIRQILFPARVLNMALKMVARNRSC